MKNSWENTAQKNALKDVTNRLNDFMGVNISDQIPRDNILKTFPANENITFSLSENTAALEL